MNSEGGNGYSPTLTPPQHGQTYEQRVYLELRDLRSILTANELAVTHLFARIASLVEDLRVEIADFKAGK